MNSQECLYEHFVASIGRRKKTKELFSQVCSLYNFALINIVHNRHRAHMNRISIDLNLYI